MIRLFHLQRQLGSPLIQTSRSAGSISRLSICRWYSKPNSDRTQAPEAREGPGPNASGAVTSTRAAVVTRSSATASSLRTPESKHTTKPNGSISLITNKGSPAVDSHPDTEADIQPHPAFIQRQKELKKIEHKNLPDWKKRNIAVKERYGTWNPTRKLSRRQMDSIKEIKDQMPSMKTAELAKIFNLSPEAIRRILKSKWVPNSEQIERMDRRTEERKQESKEKKIAFANDIQLARKRMNYGMSVELRDVKILDQQQQEMEKERKIKRTVQTFKKDGKVLYDSSINHSFYKSKKRRNEGSVKRDFRRLPFSESISDIIQ